MFISKTALPLLPLLFIAGVALSMAQEPKPQDEATPPQRIELGVRTQRIVTQNLEELRDAVQTMRDRRRKLNETLTAILETKGLNPTEYTYSGDGRALVRKPEPQGKSEPEEELNTESESQEKGGDTTESEGPEGREVVN